MLARGFWLAVAGAVAFSSCARSVRVPPGLPPSSPIASARATQAAENPPRVGWRPPQSHSGIGVLPCSVYEIRVGARRAGFAVADSAGVVRFRGALRRGDFVSFHLWRVRKCE